MTEPSPKAGAIVTLVVAALLCIAQAALLLRAIGTCPAYRDPGDRMLYVLGGSLAFLPLGLALIVGWPAWRKLAG